MADRAALDDTDAPAAARAVFGALEGTAAETELEADRSQLPGGVADLFG